MTIDVLIADDQAMVRAGFAALLDAHDGIRVTGQAANGAEAVTLSARLDPDVILMDVRMPELDGIEAAKRILGPGYPAAKVPRIIMLTTFDIDDYVYDALQAGASGFLLKDALPEDLVHAVRVVAAGDALLAPSVTRRMIAQFAAQKPRASHGAARLAELTEREREVLVLIGHGRSNSEIAATLFIAEQTVKTHVGKVLAKVGARDRVQAVIFAYDTGLVAPS
ncbi:MULTISPECIES: response regulator [Plantibacter]|uniref:Two component transcriptional regulator, LuxR family n=1 Tax=Plantibacter elymi (nom. nud.) TaxID=199708 RepID=A0ABY1R916_9MICO|nr:MULTISPECIES: response regulator transcription factor [unclassified Plantibacter]MBD8101279.1 response regulator transcription factor [Plantibacter sp. CFBP 8775]MBD8536239.1 response regulator transcription factor [Plantibacter sp. CFBP 13570]SMQ60953.1 two component transcriptional regulator, LuxR family [Plantibacter sp. VKM Ac-1784]